MEKVKKIILITGSRGMLGRALIKRLKPKYKIISLTRQDCDITDEKKLASVFSHFRPWVVIHTAAYTNVDACQMNAKKAKAINALGTQAIANGARIAGSIVIYISTDYCFSGRKKSPYREEDVPKPLNIYGKTKLEGEKLLKGLIKKHIIIRTSWLFGKGKDNFVNSILKQAKSKMRIKAVADKYSSPTYVLDLAEAILKLIDLLNSDKWSDKFYGTYHITNSGFCSWYGYAQFILRAGGLNKVKVKPIGLADIKFPARRPVFSVLDNSKYIGLTASPLRPWQEAVKEYVACRQSN